MQQQQLDRDRFLIEARQQLREWGARIDELKLGASRKVEDAGTRIGREIQDLSRRREELERHLEAAADHVSGGWSELQERLAAAMRDFGARASRALDSLGK